MTRNFITLLLATVCLQAMAQEVTDFTLKDYKYRTTGFRLANIGTSFRTGMNDDRSPLTIGQTTVNNTSDKGFGFNANGAFLKSYSLEKRQHESYFAPNTFFSYQKSKIDTVSTSVANTAFVNATYSRTERFYHKNYYTEFTGFINSGIENASFKDLKKNTFNKNLNSNLNIGVSAAIGKGRLEYVEDAQMALFILEDLKRNNLLAVQQVDKQTAYNFAALITDVRNKRVFDFRRRRMYELEQVDSFLRANKLIKASDIKVFNVINDNWAFALQAAYRQSTVSSFTNEQVPENIITQPMRYSGFRRFIKADAGPVFRRSKNESNTSESSTNVFSPFAGVTAGIEKHIPVNLKWQKVMLASLRSVYIMDRNTVNGTKVERNAFSHILNASYSMGYYPNTRTLVSFLGGVNSFYSKNDGFTASVLTGVEANYFVSFLSRVRASFSFSAIPVSETRGREMQANIQIGYVHVFY
jgi:hypothetical protein